MATQPKLIYSKLNFATLTGNDGVLNGYTSPDNQYYRSVVYTADGYIITHGTVYKTTIGTDAAVTLGLSNNTVSLGGNGEGLFDFINGTLTTVATGAHTVEGKSVPTLTFNHNTSTVTAGSYGANTAGSVSSVAVPKLTIDAYGHITAASDVTLTVDQVKSEALANGSTMYLFGKTTAAGTSTGYTSTVTVSTDASGNATLNTPKLNVTGGVSAITIGASDPKTLDKYIEDLVNTAKVQAMTYAGTTETKPTTGSGTNDALVKGDTFKASKAFTLEAADSASGSSVNVKIGDTLIYDGTKFSVIPSGDEIETFITTSDTAQSAKSKASGEVTLGNAALQVVSTLGPATSDAGLVTGKQVFDYIAGLNYSTTTGTVTSVGVASKSGLEIATTTSGAWGEDAQTATAVYRAALKSYDLNTLEALTTNRLMPVQLDKDGKLAVSVINPYSVILADTDSATANATKTAASLTLYMNFLDSITGTATKYSSIGIQASTGLKIASDAGKLTLTADVYSVSTTATIASSATGAYKIGTVTVNGTGVDLYGVDTNTWRAVYAYDLTPTAGEKLATTIGTKSLCFGNEFAYVDADANANMDGAELHLAWAEIAENGTITYAV